MKKKRVSRRECPDSMRGAIDLDRAHKLFGPDEREELREVVGSFAEDRRFDELIDELGEWVERYLRSFERRKPPSFATQKRSRQRLHSPAGRLVRAMKFADDETRKRIFHFLSDYPPEPTLKREELEEDFDYGYRIYRKLRKDLKLLDLAIIDSERPDNPRGQSRPATYLFYRVARIWMSLTGSKFTMSFGTHKKGQITALGFFTFALQSARKVSNSDQKKLRAAAARTSSKTFHATLVSAHEKIYGGVPERDTRPQEKRSRSDNDQGRKVRSESDT